MTGCFGPPGIHSTHFHYRLIMNIIVICLDTLRYDYIGAHGNTWIKTPNIDRLARQSWVFRHSYVSSYPTLPHRTDAFTGTSGSPFHPWLPLPFDAPTFPRALADAGYVTQIIHDTPHMANGGGNYDWPFHAWTFIRGAEVDRSWVMDSAVEPANWCRDPLFDCLPAPETCGWYRGHIWTNRNRTSHDDWNCAKLFRTASQWLLDNRRRTNFLLYVDCFDPHEPWDVPPEYMLMYDNTPGYDGRIDPRMLFFRNNPNLSEVARRRIAAGYAAKVSWADHWLGEFLNTFDESGLAKNTAILFTSDHGTRTGERGGIFGKGGPTVEYEVAHTPFMIRTPDGDTGSSDIIVQPMDIFATVAGLAGARVPTGLDSNDVLALARRGQPGPRSIVIAGNQVKEWGRNEGTLLTAIDREWTLSFTAKPEASVLSRHGSFDNVASQHPAVVQRLRQAAIDEVERRGTDPALVSWLRSDGKAGFPSHAKFWDRYPGPTGYYSYFSRLYTGE